MLRIRRCPVLALLAVACATSAAADESCVGRREWIGPFGSGYLRLDRDSSFVLSVHRCGARQQITGAWQTSDASFASWPTASPRQGSAPKGDTPSVVVLLVHEWSGAPLADFSDCSRLDALVYRDSATYLGTGGAMDLNWGY